MGQQGIIKIENGSYLKQLMMNLDKNPFGILKKKSFLHGETLPKFNIIKITTQFLILLDPSVWGLKNGHKNFSKAQSSEVRVRIDQSYHQCGWTDSDRIRRSPGSHGRPRPI
jgi:hypothetical protein